MVGDTTAYDWDEIVEDYRDVICNIKALNDVIMMILWLHVGDRGHETRLEKGFFLKYSYKLAHLHREVDYYVNIYWNTSNLMPQLRIGIQRRNISQLWKKRNHTNAQVGTYTRKRQTTT